MTRRPPLRAPASPARDAGLALAAERDLPRQRDVPLAEWLDAQRSRPIIPPHVDRYGRLSLNPSSSTMPLDRAEEIVGLAWRHRYIESLDHFARIGRALQAIACSARHARSPMGRMLSLVRTATSLGRLCVLQHRDGEIAGFFFEVLRLAGLPDPMAFDIVTGPRRKAAVFGVRAAIEDAQRVRLDLLEPAPMGCVDWPMAKLWKREPPDSLRLLRRFLQPLIGRALREDCQQTHARLSRTRSELFKPHLRQSIFQAIDRENDGRLGATASFVQAFVDGHIARGRRERAPAAADPMRVIASFGGSAR